MVPERRHHSRTRVESLVSVNIGQDNGGIIVDASEGGLRIRAVGLLTPDQIALLRFAPLGKNDRIETMGEIVWVDESGTGGGVRFLDLSVESSQRVKHWLALSATAGETQPQKTPIRTEPTETKLVESLLEPRQPSARVPSPASTAGAREPKPQPPAPRSYAVAGSAPFPPASRVFPTPKDRPRQEGSDEIAWRAEPAAPQRAILHEFRLGDQRAHERKAREQEVRRKNIRAGIAASLVAAAVIAGAVLFLYERARVETFLSDIKELATQGSWPSATGPATPAAGSVTAPSQPASSASKTSAANLRRKPGRSVKPSDASRLEILDSSNQRRAVKYQGPVLKLKSWPGAQVALRRDDAAQAGGSAAPKASRSQEISGGLPEQQEMPSYPALALQKNVQGTVVLRVIITKDGTVQEPVLMSGPPLLASAVLEAVRNWRYKPSYRNGEPIAVERQITVDFTISTK